MLNTMVSFNSILNLRLKNNVLHRQDVSFLFGNPRIGIAIFAKDTIEANVVFASIARTREVH